MARKVFKSKVDWWLGLIIGLVAVGMLVSVTVAVVVGGNPVEVSIAVFLCLLILAFLASIMFGTTYTVVTGVVAGSHPDTLSGTPQCLGVTQGSGGIPQCYRS